MKHANDNNFKEMLGAEVTLIDFFATWCGPCQMETEEIEKVEASRNRKFDIIKVNVDEALRTATEYGITVIPTLVAVKDGKIVKKSEGYMTAEQIEEMMSEIE